MLLNLCIGWRVLPFVRHVVTLSLAIEWGVLPSVGNTVALTLPTDCCTLAPLSL